LLNDHGAHKEARAKDPHHTEHHAPHESPWSMTVPLIVLAVLSTVGGLVGVPYAISSLIGGHPQNYFEEALAPVISPVSSTAAHENSVEQLRWLSTPPQAVDGKPAVAPIGEAPNAAAAEIPGPQEISEERLLALVSVMIALTGIGIGWWMFQRRPLQAMPRLLENKYYIDEIYDTAIINPILVTSREGFWKTFDLGVIDGVIHTVGAAVIRMGRTIRYLQIGFVRGYAAIILVGALIIIGYFAYSGVNVLKLVR